MKNNLLKIIIAVAFNLIALGTMASEAPQNKQVQKNNEVSTLDPFDDPFFQASGDVFREMDRMQQAMDQFIKHQFSIMHTHYLNQPYQRSFDRNNIEITENNKELVYKIKLPQKTDSKIDVSVKEGQLVVSSNIMQKVIHEEGNSKNISYSTSNYSQAFHLPKGYDPNSMTTQTKDDNIIVTFKKA